MDFKVTVNAWSLECYYLTLKEEEILHVIINVSEEFFKERMEAKGF